jgi:hypothetical protein
MAGNHFRLIVPTAPEYVCAGMPVSSCIHQVAWRYRAASHIQAAFRGFVVRRSVKWQHYSAGRIQRIFRAWLKVRCAAACLYEAAILLGM